jgi:thiol-disulfide isomerase/thioredoxin
VRAADAVLKVGDRAPALQTGNWVQGEPVRQFEKGKAYLVEFWATWCGPCRSSIPHLNETANKYKDKGLVVIGQDCWESDESRVAPFVKSMADKMTYRISLDNKVGSAAGRMADTWMTAAAREGIPTAFLVDKNGVIAWIGHPMTLEEKVIEEVLAGTFDMPKAANAYAERLKNELPLRALQKEVSLAIQKKDWPTASAKLTEEEKYLPENQRGELDFTRYSVLVGKKDIAGANRLAAEMLETRHNDPQVRNRLDMTRFNMLLLIQDYPSANQLALHISDTHKDDASVQNLLAWQMVGEQTIEPGDLTVAEIIATRAIDAGQGKDVNPIDTLARILIREGRKEEATELLQKAVDLASGPDKQRLQNTLDSYRKNDGPKAE